MTAPGGRAAWAAQADEIIRAGATLGGAGLTPGTTGNLSVRSGAGALVTGTGARLSGLSRADIAVLSEEGLRIEGARPTKEAPLHVAIYRARADIAGLVHLHSPAAVAVSCLDGLAAWDPLPIYTPYFAMRVGRIAMLPYLHPGGDELADAAAEAFAEGADAVLLGNHGLICAGDSLSVAVIAAEELEANCELHLRLWDKPTRVLDSADATHLHQQWRRTPGAQRL